MATNVDFDNLIQRITDATNTLEASVLAISDGSGSIGDQVLLAQQAALDAQEAVSQAQAAALDSSTSSQEALQAVTDAIALVEQLEASVVLTEAPIDGQGYVRKDAQWVIESSSGGSGTVTSVNSKSPDVSGNVLLDYTDVNALPDSYTPSWDDVTAKPTEFTPEAHTHDASDIVSGVLDVERLGSGVADETKVLFGDGSWKDAPTGGGGGASGGYPVIDKGVLLDGRPFTEWPYDNPNTPIQLSRLSMQIGPRLRTGGQLFSYSQGVEALPDGNYSFVNSTFSSAPLKDKVGVISVRTIRWGTESQYYKQVTATANKMDSYSQTHEIYSHTIYEGGATAAWMPMSYA